MPGGAQSRIGRWRIIGGGVIVLGLIAVLAVALLPGSGHSAAANPGAGVPPASRSGASPSGASPSGAAADSSLPGPVITGPAPPPISPALTLGRADARITMIEFGDYQCTSCAAFARDTQAALIRKYVDTGVVRLVWWDFPWVNSQSVDAAVAARAAGRQGKFWQFHDYLFAHQFPTEGSGQLTSAFLLSVARKTGLNLASFSRDVRDPVLRREVLADGAYGQATGVPGTPAFLIGGRPFFGAQPLSAFAAAIAQARG